MEIIKTPAAERVNPTNLYVLTIDTTEGDLDGSHTCKVHIKDNKDQVTLDKIKKYAILLERVKAFKRHGKERHDFNYLKGFNKLLVEGETGEVQRGWFYNGWYYDWIYGQQDIKWIYYDENGQEFDIEIKLDEEEMAYALDKSIWHTDPIMEWSKDYDWEIIEEEEEEDETNEEENEN